MGHRHVKCTSQFTPPLNSFSFCLLAVGFPHGEGSGLNGRYGLCGLIDSVKDLQSVALPF